MPLITLVLSVATSGCGNSGDARGDFCSTHECISNFDNGNGYVIECTDGTYSHSGGVRAPARTTGETAKQERPRLDLGVLGRGGPLVLPPEQPSDDGAKELARGALAIVEGARRAGAAR